MKEEKNGGLNVKIFSRCSFDDISGKIYRANGKRINTFVIMSNMHLTPQCQDNITDLEKLVFCRVMDWAGLNFRIFSLNIPIFVINFSR